MSDDRLKKLLGKEPLEARYLNPASVTFRVQGKDPETLTDPEKILTRILDDYLKNPTLTQRVMSDLKAQILDASDHTAYRELADAVTDSTIGDPFEFIEMDASELELLVQYLKNARDLARHEAAEEQRDVARRYTDSGPYKATLMRAADELDPYVRGAEGLWIRKSDGTVVSWRLVHG